MLCKKEAAFAHLKRDSFEKIYAIFDNHNCQKTIFENHNLLVWRVITVFF